MYDGVGASFHGGDPMNLEHGIVYKRGVFAPRVAQTLRDGLMDLKELSLMLGTPIQMQYMQGPCGKWPMYTQGLGFVRIIIIPLEPCTIRIYIGLKETLYQETVFAGADEDSPTFGIPAVVALGYTAAISGDCLIAVPK